MKSTLVNAAMRTRGTRPSEKLILIALAGWADDNDTTHISQAHIAALLELSPTTVGAGLRSLEAKGHISRTPTYWEDGGRDADSITLHLVMPGNLAVLRPRQAVV